MTNTETTTATLSDTHRAVLRYLVDAESVSEYTPRVEAGNRGLEGTAPYATLRAMERRGLVAMRKRAQAAVGAPAVSYWTAELTDAGRDALAAWDAEQTDADPERDEQGNVTGDLLDLWSDMSNYCPRCRGHHRKAKRNYEDEVTAQTDADRMTGELKPDWPFEVYRCPLGNIHVGVPKPRFRIGPKLPAD